MVFSRSSSKDKKNKLINAQEGVTKALRQWRFDSINEIELEAELIKEYLEEAISNHQHGKVIKRKNNKPLVIPDELQKLLILDSNLKQCFESLLSRRKENLLITLAKRKEWILNKVA